MFVESGPGIRSSLRDLPTHLTLLTVSHGFMGWVFSITGPMLILLSVAEQGNLPTETTVSWIFIGLMVGGVISWTLSLYYRQPLTAAITIPGMVLVGTALNHVTFPEVIGAYLVTGTLLILIALSGKIKTVMDWFPLPIATNNTHIFSHLVVREFRQDLSSYIGGHCSGTSHGHHNWTDPW